jgi:hypothetical protein
MHLLLCLFFLLPSMLMGQGGPQLGGPRSVDPKSIPADIRAFALSSVEAESPSRIRKLVRVRYLSASRQSHS